MRRRKNIITWFLLVALIVCSFLPATDIRAAEEGIVIGNSVIRGDIEYSIQNAYSTDSEEGWFMNVKGAGKSNGTVINLWPLDMSEPISQRFKFNIVDSQNRIVKISPSNGNFLDVRRNGKAFVAGQGIVIWEEDYDPLKELYLEFQEDGSFYITFSTQSGYCIAPKSQEASHTKQQQLVVKAKTGATYERWFLCDKDGNRLNIQDAEEKSGLKFSNLDELRNVAENLKNDTQYRSWLAHKIFEVTYTSIAINFVEEAYEKLENLYRSAKCYGTDNAEVATAGQQLSVALVQDINSNINKLENYRKNAGSALKKRIDELISAYKTCLDTDELTEAVFQCVEYKALGEEGVIEDYCVTDSYSYVTEWKHKRMFNWKNKHMQASYGSIAVEELHNVGADNKCSECGTTIEREYYTGKKIPAGYTAPPIVGEEYVKQRLDELVALLDGKYFTVSGEACSATRKSAHGSPCTNCLLSNILNGSKNNWFGEMFGSISIRQMPQHSVGSETMNYDGRACFGFACFGQFYVCSEKTTDYLCGERIASGSFTKKSINSMGVKPGDVLRMTNNNGEGLHSVVVYSVEENGVMVIDSNYHLDSAGREVLNCKVQKHMLYFSGDYYSGSPVILNRACNYIP